MQRKSHNEIHWLQFDHLTAARVTHGVFLRHGGIDVGTVEGHDPQVVENNIERIKDVLKLPCLHSLKQVHGTNIIAVDNPVPPGYQGDAMLCTTPGQALMVKHADCQVALFYDPVQKVIAGAHSGWRGSVQNIYAAVIQRLEAQGCRPEDLLVGITPSLGPCHAEFRNYRNELPESFWRYQVKPNYFDFWAITTEQLTHCGIRLTNIEIARQCTYANSTDFFSHRRDKITGRHATVIML